LGKVTIREAIRDVAILLLPMLAILLFVIVFPDAVLALPRWIKPQFMR
jgi:TRAP-type C4-dicarboxylate transport system permease large subunit